MREKVASKYRYNAVAGKRKHIYSRLLDYFSTFVLSYLVFTAVYAISSNFTIVRNNVNAYSSAGNQIVEFISLTHLQNYNDSKSGLADISIDAKAYIVSMLKTTAYVHDVKIPVKEEEDRYVNIDETFINDLSTYKLDNLSYYYKNFKKNSEASIEGSRLSDYVYEGVDYKDNIDVYQYNKIMKVDSSMYVASDDIDLLNRGGGVSNFTVLTLENFEKLKYRVFLDDRTNENINRMYNKIFDTYIAGAEYGIKDVESKSIVYADKTADFKAAYQLLVKTVAVVYYISYTITFVLLAVVMRLIAKEWCTLGQFVMKVGMSDNKENEVSAIQIVGYNLINFVLFSTSSIISFVFLGMLGITALEIFPHFTLLAILIALLILNIISFGMEFFGKIPHDLSTFITKIHLKDKNDYDVPVGMENISDEEYNKIKEPKVETNE